MAPILLAARKGTVMNKLSFFLFFLYSLFIASPLSAAAENQTWKVRPDDNLDIIATTLEIPKEEIKKAQSRGFGEQCPNRPKAETAASLVCRK